MAMSVCLKRPLNLSSLDQSHPRPFQILSKEEKKNFSFFRRLPFPKAWVESEDCNAMADNLTQCGLGKEARPVRLNFDTSSLEKVVVIFS